VELVIGDVRDAGTVEKALLDVDAVYHLAAAVGVGQSMYQIQGYTSVNGQGTAVLLEALIRNPVERLIVASSMSIYGEGLYRKKNGQIVEVGERPLHQLKKREWELRGDDGELLQPAPTPETKTPALPSVYAISKYEQERLCMTVAKAYNIEAVALRFFNIYGTRQALSNPYTGVLAIFASRLLNGNPPLVNEDGLQRRDFVSVRDVVQGCRLALETPGAANRIFNIGSGENVSVLEIADQLAELLDCRELKPEITGRYRIGDIRNCFANISEARRVLNYKPSVKLEDGLKELAQWLEGQTAIDRTQEARLEMGKRGLTI
jgi:dTDP-L-rhamnose 4-epimerase